MAVHNELSNIPPHIRESESYKSALAYMQAFQAKEGVDYGWVHEYAKLLWDERNEHYTEMDEKADSIIKYLGAGWESFPWGYSLKPIRVTLTLSLGHCPP